MEVRVLRIKAQDRISVLDCMRHVHFQIIVSELSGYEPTSPLVTSSNVFPSLGNDLRIVRQFFAHIEDSDCFSRVELFLLEGFDCFFVITLNDLVNLEVPLLRQLLSTLPPTGTCHLAHTH